MTRLCKAAVFLLWELDLTWGGTIIIFFTEPSLFNSSCFEGLLLRYFFFDIFFFFFGFYSLLLIVSSTPQPDALLMS